jgi:hypothetical protein
MKFRQLRALGGRLRAHASTALLKRRYARRRSLRRILLHIGAHKTGSSVVQSLLKAESSRLRWQGFGYERAFYRLGRLLAHRSPLPADEREAVRLELEARLDGRPEPTIIGSSESLFGDPFICYANVRQVAEDLRALLAGWDVEIVACIRRQDEFVESLYHQHVKQGGALTFEQFARSHDIGAYRWDELLGEYAAVFGREHLSVCCYDVVFRPPGDVIAAMFPPVARAGFRTRARPEVVNPSLSRKGLELALRCNGMLTPDERKAFRGFLERTFPRAAGESHALFTAAQREELLRTYAPSNRRCFEAFLRGGTHAPGEWLTDTPADAAFSPLQAAATGCRSDRTSAI